MLHRRGSTGVDDDELIAGDGSNLVLSGDHGDLGGVDIGGGLGEVELV